MAKTVTQHQLLIFLVVFLNLGSVSAGIRMSPDIVEVSVGETVSFNCADDFNTVIPNFEWHHIRIDRLHDLIYKDGYIYRHYKNRYNVRSGIDYSSLIINNVTMDDAGRFICMEFEDATSQKEAKLIVFVRFPSGRFCIVITKFSPEYLAEVSCQMEYRGNIAPSMEWIDNGGNLVNSSTNTIYGITTSAMHLTRDQIRNSYSCQIQYVENVLVSRFQWSYSYEMLGYMLQPEEEVNTLSIHAFIAVATCCLVLCVLTVILSLIIIRMYRKKRQRKDSGNLAKTLIDHLETPASDRVSENFGEEQQLGSTVGESG